MGRIIERQARLPVVRVDQHDASSRARDAQHLAQPGLRIIEMLEDPLGAHRVECAIRERQTVDTRDVQLHRMSGRRGRLARRLDHRLRQVDPGDPP